MLAFNVIKPNLRFYSCVILNDYKTNNPTKYQVVEFYSCVILNVMRREKIIFIIGLRNKFPF